MPTIDEDLTERAELADLNRQAVLDKDRFRIPKPSEQLIASLEPEGLRERKDWRNPETSRRAGARESDHPWPQAEPDTPPLPIYRLTVPFWLTVALAGVVAVVAGFVAWAMSLQAVSP